MKIKMYKSLGFEVPVEVAESVEEYNKLAGRDNAVLDDANDSNAYRCSSGLNKFRRTLCSLVEKEFGVKRRSKPARPAKEGESLDKVPIKYTESESDYISRVKVEKDLTDKDLLHLVKEASTGLVSDPSVTESEGGSGGKIAKIYMQLAEGIASRGKLEAFAAKHGCQPTLEAVARQIKSIEDARRREREAELVADI